MAKRFKTIYVDDEELESWKEAAGGGSLNLWIRTSLNSQVELDNALKRLSEEESGLSDNLEPHG